MGAQNGSHNSVAGAPPLHQVSALIKQEINTDSLIVIRGLYEFDGLIFQCHFVVTFISISQISLDLSSFMIWASKLSEE